MSKSSYRELRQHFSSDQTCDPRLRRILGLPELGLTETAAALIKSRDRKSKSSTSILSPTSPAHYASPPHNDDNIGPRLDPRKSATLPTATTADTTGKQRFDIRTLLQNSDWYKNLTSKFKIMVNQQLALVSTELRKFHHDPSPNKIFDIQFIVSNQNLQQILTNLGVYIDGNGDVISVESGSEASTYPVNQHMQPPPFMNYRDGPRQQMVMNNGVGNMQPQGPPMPIKNMNMMGGPANDFGQRNMYNARGNGILPPPGRGIGYFRNNNIGQGGEFNNPPFPPYPFNQSGNGNNNFFNGQQMPNNCNVRNKQFNRNRNRN